MSFIFIFKATATTENYTYRHTLPYTTLFRARGNAGRLSQEQIIPMMNVDDEKWKSLAKDLKDELGIGARFDDVYLIDDFTASGTTFVRFPDGEPKGKLCKFEKAEIGRAHV